jgi:hypothetical protein
MKFSLCHLSSSVNEPHCKLSEERRIKTGIKLFLPTICYCMYVCVCVPSPFYIQQNHWQLLCKQQINMMTSNVDICDAWEIKYNWPAWINNILNYGQWPDIGCCAYGWAKEGYTLKNKKRLKIVWWAFLIAFQAFQLF